MIKKEEQATQEKKEEKYEDNKSTEGDHETSKVQKESDAMES